MGWKNLNSLAEWEQVKQASFSRPQLVFKHSTRCSISLGVKYRLDDRSTKLEQRYDLHFLDLLNHRDISNQIAGDTNVWHESPQVIVMDQGKAVYHKSHGMISPDVLLDLAIQPS